MIFLKEMLIFVVVYFCIMVWFLFLLQTPLRQVFTTTSIPQLSATTPIQCCWLRPLRFSVAACSAPSAAVRLSHPPEPKMSAYYNDENLDD